MTIMLGILNLPPEIHLWISFNLSFIDLFSLVKTCKVLRRNCLVSEIFKNRSIEISRCTGEQDLFLSLGITGYTKIYDSQRVKKRGVWKSLYRDKGAKYMCKKFEYLRVWDRYMTRFLKNGNHWTGKPSVQRRVHKEVKIILGLLVDKLIYQISILSDALSCHKNTLTIDIEDIREAFDIHFERYLSIQALIYDSTTDATKYYEQSLPTDKKIRKGKRAGLVFPVTRIEKIMIWEIGDRQRFGCGKFTPIWGKTVGVYLTSGIESLIFKVWEACLKELTPKETVVKRAHLLKALSKDIMLKRLFRD